MSNIFFGLPVFYHEACRLLQVTPKRTYNQGFAEHLNQGVLQKYKIKCHYTCRGIYCIGFIISQKNENKCDPYINVEDMIQTLHEHHHLFHQEIRSLEVDLTNVLISSLCVEQETKTTAMVNPSPFVFTANGYI
jgi:hypothetical protein